MQEVFSFFKQDYLIYLNSLYVFRNFSTYVEIEQIDLKTLDSLEKIEIKTSFDTNIRPIVDSNCFYFIDKESNLIIVDKVSGEIFNQISLRSICVAEIQQGEQFIYVLCLLPTNVRGIRFSTYFVQKINKKTGSSTKFAFREGVPGKGLKYIHDCLLLADLEHVLCLSSDGEEWWSVSLKSKMNNPIEANNKHVVASAPNGLIQGFDANTGENKFNIQMKHSKAQPLLQDEWLWFCENQVHAVNIEKVINRIPGWKQQIDFPISGLLCGTRTNDGMLVGNISGHLSFNNRDPFQVSKSPILSLSSFDETIIAETSDHVIGLRP